MDIWIVIIVKMHNRKHIDQDISQSSKLLTPMQQQSPKKSPSNQQLHTVQLSTQYFLKNKGILYLWGIGIALGAFIMGYFFVIVSVLTAAMVQFHQKSASPGDVTVLVSVCTTAMPVGALIGSLMYSRILKLFRSQNRLLVWLCLLTALSLILQSISLSLPIYSTIRLFQGFLSGIFGNAIPPYLISIAPTQVSGFMGSLNQIMITIGIAAAYAMGYVLDQKDLLHPVYWRLCVLLPLPLCLIQVAVCKCFNYDAIERHIRRRQWRQLFQYVQQFYRHGTFTLQQLIISKNISLSTIPTRIPRSLSQLNLPNNTNTNMQQQQAPTGCQSQLQASNRQENRSTPGLQNRRMLSLVVAIISQFSGINSILFYSNQLFMDISGGNVQYAVDKSLQLGAFQILVTGFSGAFIDRFGRRSLMLAGEFLVIAALFIAYYVLDFWQKGTANQIVAFAIFMHMAGFSLSLGPITVVYISQIMTDISPYMTFIWIQTIAISFGSNIMMQRFGTGKVFLFFAVISTIGFLYLCKNMMETKGKTRQQVVNSFENAAADENGENCIKNGVELEETKEYKEVAGEE